MVASAPSSVRFVLASRSHVRGLAVLRAAGEVLDVDEDDLSLSASETVQLAALYRVDPSVPASAGGWPAAATMAAAYASVAHTSTCSKRARAPRPFDRKVLAVAAAIGGGDPDVLRAAVGRAESDPADVLARLPLVTTSESGEFVVHDLWRRVLGEALDRDEVVGAVARAVDALVEREDFNRAFELCIERGDWQAATDTLGPAAATATPWCASTC